MKTQKQSSKNFINIDLITATTAIYCNYNVS